MTASGITDPPDDGSNANLLRKVRDCTVGHLVWDSEGLIRAQYEEKLNETTFAREWLGDLLLAGRVLTVDRAKLAKAKRIAITDTGLVGEDLQRYVRTAVNSPDKTLVSHDSDYDAATCQALKKQVGVKVCAAVDASELVTRREAEADQLTDTP